MQLKTLAVVAVSSLLLVGCVESDGFSGSGGTGGFGGAGGSGGFGGSGGNSDAGLSLARDVCVQDVRDRGQRQVRVVSARNFGTGPSYAQVTLESRRDGMSANTNRWSCRFSYSTGRPATTRI